MHGHQRMSQISIRVLSDELDTARQLALTAARLKRFDLRNRSDVLREAMKQGLIKLASELKPPAPAKPRPPAKPRRRK